jgi:hypothetical protein
MGPSGPGVTELSAQPPSPHASSLLPHPAAAKEIAATITPNIFLIEFVLVI